jgi:hypothetical protein
MVRTLPIVLVVLLLGLVARPGAQGQAGGASALVDAALARVREASPDLPLEHAEIVRVVGDHALVRVFPGRG